MTFSDAVISSACEAFMVSQVTSITTLSSIDSTTSSAVIDAPALESAEVISAIG